MNWQSVVQAVASVANILNVVVLAVGYYFLIKLYREWVDQMRQSREAGGRPQVVVAADYSHLPEVYGVVRNFTEAPAKGISFAFTSPVESSSGLVISDLPFFQKGLPFLAPRGEVNCYWDRLPSLIPLLKARGLEGGIKVTTKYKDLAGQSYDTEWTLDPLLFEGAPIHGTRGMSDLVSAVEKISEPNRDERPGTAGGGKRGDG